MAHAFTYIRFFSAHGVYNPRDIYETELRKLFDYKTEALARRLKKAVGGKYRVRYRKTAAAGEELVELPDWFHTLATWSRFRQTRFQMAFSSHRKWEAQTLNAWNYAIIRTVWSLTKLAWCLFEMWNSPSFAPRIAPPLWFDAYLKCETVSSAANGAGCDLMLIWNVKQSASRRTRARRVVIWCLFEMWNSAQAEVDRGRQLWFDAYLKCETVQRGSGNHRTLLWFDAYLKCETVMTKNPITPNSCDLMLIWNVKQCRHPRRRQPRVVIWCLFEMWNSAGPDDLNETVLWFDAYLKCETV